MAVWIGEVVVTANGAATKSTNSWVAEFWGDAESVTVSWMSYEPDAEVTPARVPSEFRVSPVGSEPPATDHA